uniref:Heparanase n=1 Tax=Arion vulgaris TaxID=1028688 RepID=A0A0B7A307_9EUPU
MHFKNNKQNHSRIIYFVINCILWAFILSLVWGGSHLVTGSPYVEDFKVLSDPVSEAISYRVFANITSSLHKTDTKFLSLTIDTYDLRYNWEEFFFKSKKLHNLAAALSPSDLRFGGTYSDFLTFDPTATHFTENNLLKNIRRAYQIDFGIFNRRFTIEEFTMSGSQWSSLNTFIEEVGWDLLYDVNLFKWNDGMWDPTNLELLLDYSSESGFKIPYFQLGNEPNTYPHNFNVTIPPETLTADLLALKAVLSKYPLYKDSSLFGPDVTNLNVPHRSVQYLSEFITAGAYNVVSGITLHHYYMNGKTAVQMDFLNLTIMNSMKRELELAVNIAATSPIPLPISITETSTCFAGGAPGLSDSYIGSFLWLDKLGLSAQYGVARVFRQTFLGTPDGLLADNMNPNPDFYLSVLFKKLIEGPVFNVSIDPQDENLRIYIHCARRKLYKAGAIVIYYLNVQANEAILDFPQFQDADLDLYLFTPGDDGLISRHFRLNNELVLMPHASLPPLRPQPHKGKVTVSPVSFGFIVIRNANVQLCIKHFAHQK